MGRIGKGSQIVLAGAGFLAGYGWAVFRWAARGGLPTGGDGARALLSTGVPLACCYALLLTVFFWPCLPSAKGAGLRVVVAPTAFSLSALLAALSMEFALRFVG